MRTWYKADLFSSFLVIFGIVCLIFSNSSILTVSCFLLSSVILLHGVYRARFECVKYRDVLCHYQAVLSSADQGWIAWNGYNEYVGASKKLRSLCGIKHSAPIYFTEILTAFASDDAEQLSQLFGKLKKTGDTFTFVARSKKILLEICGSKMTINGLETFSLWCNDVTEFRSKVQQLEKNVDDARGAADGLRELLDIVPLPLWKRDNDLRIVYCNKAYADALDGPRERILLNNVPLIPGVLFGQGHSLAETAKKCNKTQVVSQFVALKGMRKKLSIHEVPAAHGNFAGFALDVTSEENLASSLDRVVTANYEVLENLSTAIAIFGENTRLVFFNSAYQKLMKLEAGWLHSKPSYAEVLDERRNNRQLPEHADFQAFKKSQLALFTSVTSPSQELMHLPNGNTLRSVVAPYPLGGLLFMFEDVTDSLALQRKNNTLLAVQKETLDHLQEGIIVYGSDNRLKVVNNAAMQLWNMEERLASDLKGVHLSEMLENMKACIDYGEDWESFLETSISNFTDRIAKSGKLAKMDGSIVLFSYIPLPDGAHMLSYSDVTDAQKVETAVREKDQALEAAQKLRYEFIHGISTELREPLNALIGFAELLIQQYYGPLNEKQMEYCMYILSSSNQLNQLINNLMEMVSIDVESEKLEVSFFTIGEAVGEVLANIEKRAHEKNITVVSQLGEIHECISGDRKRLKQAIFNVLLNAIQSTPINGKIEIKEISDERNIKIIIKNECLVRARSQKSVFLKSLPRRPEPSTVSMPLVRSLLELHGGTLSITVDLDGNSCVICSLPRYRDVLGPIYQNESEQRLNGSEFSAVSGTA
ncbi:MAG: PAS-domain containing protein [Holosporaceae bacterium]|jgi:signal transduction histidine kinase/PAS domain-containing protein|nr:PAS-domain containing protein [Holosporaceae bacterium]